MLAEETRRASLHQDGACLPPAQEEPEGLHQVQTTLPSWTAHPLLQWLGQAAVVLEQSPQPRAVFLPATPMRQQCCVMGPHQSCPLPAALPPPAFGASAAAAAPASVTAASVTDAAAAAAAVTPPLAAVPAASWPSGAASLPS